MKDTVIQEVMQSMLPFLDNAQLLQLQAVLTECLAGRNVVAVQSAEAAVLKLGNDELLNMFLAAKKVEGCSDRTIRYYRLTLQKALGQLKKHLTHITTEDLRAYLSGYQEAHGCSQRNIDNIRRILSSFFAWLEEEDYILKSPVRRIHKIRTAKVVKETYSDEALEQMRDNCMTLRDLAIIDMLASTGMRVGELVRLNRADIDFANRECVVLGKGSKERSVYFDARTKIHLQNYLSSRQDDNPALFVSLQRPYRRLQISGVEIRLRALGCRLGINKVHPHKFRRTLATKAIDKGMPIEQVQQLLGHSKIDTTMEYAMVDQNNVKISHRRYIA